MSIRDEVKIRELEERVAELERIVAELASKRDVLTLKKDKPNG